MYVVGMRYHRRMVKKVGESYFERLLDDYESLGVRTKDGCLIWQYSCVSKDVSNDYKGYGLIYIERRQAQLTRVMWHYFVDPNFPIWVVDSVDMFVIDHQCDDTRCYEPSHLQAVPQSKNVGLGKLGILKDTKTSRYIGVHWSNRDNKWVAKFRRDGRRLSRMFDSEEDAHDWYVRAQAKRRLRRSLRAKTALARSTGSRIIN